MELKISVSLTLQLKLTLLLTEIKLSLYLDVKPHMQLAQNTKMLLKFKLDQNSYGLCEEEADGHYFKELHVIGYGNIFSSFLRPLMYWNLNRKRSYGVDCAREATLVVFFFPLL